MVTSPPRGAVRSLSTFTPVLASNSAMCCVKVASPLPIILNISSTMLLGFLITADVAVFHRQVAHVFHPGRQGVTVATSLYVLRDNLFHVHGEKPFRSLLVCTNNLLVKRCFGKRTAATLLDPPHRMLQFRHVRSGDHQIVGYINK